MLFLSADWKIFADKCSWANEIREVTRIPESMLRLEKDISAASVAERLSWAANRKTTRPEDIAYCLFGLFGITLPLSYGEGGESAFYRLQEEIIRTAVDMSIFAWGEPHKVDMGGGVGDILVSLESQRGDHWEPHGTSAGDITRRPYLLASSPDAFSQLMEFTVRVVNLDHLRIARRAPAESHCFHSRNRPLRRAISGQDLLWFLEVFKPMYLPFISPTLISWQFVSIAVVINFIPILNQAYLTGLGFD